MLVVESKVGQAIVTYASKAGRSLAAVATDLDLSEGELRQVLEGERRPDEALGARLATLIGGSPDDWLESDPTSADAAWVPALEEFGDKSLRALRERGHIRATKKNRPQLAAELATFFDCAPDDRASLVPAAFRQSSAYEVHRDAVEVWLRLASLQAVYVAELEGVPELSRDELRLLLPELVQVGDEKPTTYLPRVKEQLAEVGVTLVFQPDVSGTRLFGASWPSPDGSGVVALTLQRGTDDFFWWTVFHECAHLILGHGPVLHGETGDGSQQEHAADRLARELILPRAWDAPVRRPSKRRLQTLAAALRVPAGLLVGQLQHSRRVEPHHMWELKKPTPDTGDLEVRPSAELGHGPGWGEAVSALLRSATG